MRRECSWCKKVVEEGKEPTSHTICQDCFDEYYPEDSAESDVCLCCSGKVGKGAHTDITLTVSHPMRREHDRVSQGPLCEPCYRKLFDEY